jgi:hypothetical protein
MRLQTAIEESVAAAFGGIWVRSHEHEDAIREIASACSNYSWIPVTWNAEHGTAAPEGVVPGPPRNDPTPLAALNFVRSIKPEDKNQHIVLTMRNLHPLLFTPDGRIMNPVLLQALQHTIEKGTQTGLHVVILAHDGVKIPAEIEKQFRMLDHDLPNAEEMSELFVGIEESNKLPGWDTPEGQMILEAAAGLTRAEAAGAASLSIARDDCIKPSTLWEIKADTLKKSGLLQVYQPKTGFDMIGGLNVLKSFCVKSILRDRKTAGDAKARGVMVLGVPGVGKSAFAKALGYETSRPTLSLDIGALMGSLVGQTEEQVRRALKQADQMAPCILFCDEMEKGLAGSGGGEHDSGVGARMLGYLLSWLQDHESDVYCIGTCLSGDTIVQTGDGSLWPMNEAFNVMTVRKSKAVLAADSFSTVDDNGGNLSAAGRVIYQGRKDTIELLTGAGPIECTTDHVFFTVLANEVTTSLLPVTAANLKPGDLIAAPMTMTHGSGRPVLTRVSPQDIHGNSKEVLQPSGITEPLAYLVGYMCGDGGLGNTGANRVRDTRIQWNEQNSELVNHVRGLFKELFGVETGMVTHDNTNYCYVDSVVVCDWWTANFPTVFVANENRSVPRCITQCDASIVKQFLAGLFDAEGTCGKNNIAVSMVTKRLIQESSLLLKRFDIQSTYSEFEPDEPRKTVYRWTVADRESVENFVAEIPLRHTAKQTAAVILGESCEGSWSSCRDVPACHELVHRMMKKVGLSAATRLPNFRNRSQTMSHDTADIWLAVMAQAKVPSQELDQLKKLWSFRWLKVRGIGRKTIQDVYDVHIENPLHRFVANGVLVHNCNDISKIAAVSAGAFLRAERWDGVFFVDLPTPEQLEVIWQIWIKHFNLTPEQTAKRPVSDKWTGAEVRACCRLAALFDTSLEDAAEKVVPVSVTSKESIDQLRSFASHRCLSADFKGVFDKDARSKFVAKADGVDIKRRKVVRGTAKA